MSRLFGKPKSNAASKPTLNDTASTLDLRIETFNKQIAAIDQELQAYSKLPPARKASQKARAMALLSKKKMFEKQRMTLEGQVSNISNTAFAVSNIETQKQVYNGLRDAKNQLAKGYKDMKIEKVENLMDDLDDHMLDQDEMNEMFSRPMGQNTYMTDADLESELASLSTEPFEPQMYPTNTLRMPSVPVEPIDTRNQVPQNNTTVDQFGLPKYSATRMKS